MESRIRIELSVPAEVRRDGGYFVSFCPPFDVYSQGPDEDTALVNLVEALRLFIESCFARGALEQVLKDCGFEPDTDPEPVEGRREDGRMVRVPIPLVAHGEAHTH